LLKQHPEIEDIAVVGVPDGKWGEVGHAFVIPKKGSNLSPQDVIGFCREQLAKFKCPQKVSFCKDFPRTALGKVRKKELIKILNS